MGRIHRLYIYLKKKHKIDTHIIKLKEGPLPDFCNFFFFKCVLDGQGSVGNTQTRHGPQVEPYREQQTQNNVCSINPVKDT